MEKRPQPDPRDEVLSDIALKYLRMETLETCHMASLDYRLLPVWDIRKALEAAYAAALEYS